MDEDEDPFDARIRKSGCAKFHFALQDCVDQHKDFRACQQHMKDFKVCMDSKKKPTKESAAKDK